MFSFLARKTDFYTGGGKGKAETILMEKFKKYEKQALDKHNREVAEREEQDRVRKEKLRKKREEEEQAAAKIMEVDDEEAKRIQAEIEAKKQAKENVAPDVATAPAAVPTALVVFPNVFRMMGAADDVSDCAPA